MQGYFKTNWRVSVNLIIDRILQKKGISLSIIVWKITFTHQFIGFRGNLEYMSYECIWYGTKLKKIITKFRIIGTLIIIKFWWINFSLIGFI